MVYIKETHPQELYETIFEELWVAMWTNGKDISKIENREYHAYIYRHDRKTRSVPAQAREDLSSYTDNCREEGGQPVPMRVCSLCVRQGHEGYGSGAII